MNKPIFKLDELNMQEFEHLELAKEGKLLLFKEDQKALLSGRRTLQMPIPGINQHPAIDAKISLVRNTAGEPELRLHPIYKSPSYPQELTDVEAEKLINGETASIYRTVQNAGEPDRKCLFEFDGETREFIRTDPDKIEVPDQVNGEELTAAQKELFRKGKEVELSDGTSFKFTGVDPEPIRSNKYALVASILLDGGISYVLYTGIRSLVGAKQAEKNEAYSLGYQKAIADMQLAGGQQKKEEASLLPSLDHNDDGISKEYARSGPKR